MGIILTMLLLCGDLHENPGPPPTNVTLSSNSTISETSDSIFSENMRTFVSLLHLNIQSVKPKINVIIGYLSEFDILCFTESWLNLTVANTDIEIPGFDSPHRNDRADRLGGGVIVYCKDHLVSKRRPDLEPAN